LRGWIAISPSAAAVLTTRRQCLPITYLPSLDICPAVGRGRRYSGSVAAYPQGIDDLLDVIRQIEVSTESRLLPVTGSLVDALTLAVLVIEPACLGITAISIDTVAPLARSPKSHVTTPASLRHDPCVGVAETKSTVGGIASTTAVRVAVSGPPFVTCTV
jgi:hypothetical protein